MENIGEEGNTNIAELEFKAALEALHQVINLDQRTYKPDKDNTPMQTVMVARNASTDSIPLTKPSKIKGKAKTKSKAKIAPLKASQSQESIEIKDRNPAKSLLKRKWESYNH